MHKGQLPPSVRNAFAPLIAGLFLLGLAVGCGEESGSPSSAASSSSVSPDTMSPAAVEGDRDSLRETSESGLELSSSQQPLSAAQKERLGPAVRRLLGGNTLASDTLSQAVGIRKTDPAGERDGEDVYSVLVEGTGPETLRDADLPVTSASGGTVAARLTTAQIRKVASLQEVRRIRFPKQAEPQ